MAGELLKAVAKIDMTHVPYRGAAPAISDLLGGQVQVYLGSLPATIEHIRAGKLRALAVTTSTRFEGLPDIPTVSDFVPGYEASQWFGAGLHKKTSTEIVNTLNKEINIALADAKMKARLADLGTTVFPRFGHRFGKVCRRRDRQVGRGEYHRVPNPTDPESQQLADFAIKARLPMISAFRFFTDAGGLMSYGATTSEIYTNAAEQVAQILNGTRPSDLPLRQATRFELVINLKTANALGLTIPPSLLARADEVIE